MNLVVGQKARRSMTVTQLQIRITRQDGTTVLEGEAWCYTFSPNQQSNQPSN